MHSVTTHAMPVVVGAPRSGTTLLRLMIDAHPEIAIPPETGFLALGRRLADGADQRQAFFETVTTFPPDAPAWRDFGIPNALFRQVLEAIEPFSASEGCRAFYRMYAARFGKPRWGDKTPTYCFHLRTIASLLPEARVVHLIRDGRDVALSLRPMWFSPGRDIETLADYWRRCIAAAREQSGAVAGYLEVRFEDLIQHTEPVLRRICRFLAADFHPEMLNYYQRAPRRLTEHCERRCADGSLVISQRGRLQQQALTMSAPQSSRVQCWRREMKIDECRRFESVAGDLLDALEYGLAGACA